MPVRVEIAKTGRAGCKNKECKDNGVKIGVGELRYGVLVEIPNTGHTSWSWKHWGCVTPQQISNLQKELRDDDDAYDFDALDGFDEVNPESCNKIREAVEAGHVADEDWKGDLEMNRPGKRGTRVKTPKKKAAEEDDGNTAENGTPTKPKASKRGAKRTKKEDGDDDGEEAEAPQKKKPRATKAKKVKQEELEDDAAEDAPQPKKARATKDKKAKQEELEDEATEDAPQPKKTRATKDKKVKDEEAEDDEAAGAPKPKTTKAKQVKAEEDDEAPRPAKKRGRAKVKDTHENTEMGDEEEDADAEISAPAARKGGRKARPPAAEEAGDAGEVAPEKPKAKRGRQKKTT